MITEHDLQEAIAECEGQRNPTSSTCIKLAAFYTIKNHLFGSGEYVPSPAYSFAAPNTIDYDSGTEFSQKINGQDQQAVLPVMDELMDLLKVLYPKIYNSVMKKL